MKPAEFWDCTYREAKLYVQSFFEQKNDEIKVQIQLMDALSDKLLSSNPQVVKKPKYKKLTEVFEKLFKKEQKVEQSLEEQISILRGWKK